MPDIYLDAYGRDPYPGEDDPTPKPCPECGHSDWLLVTLPNPPLRGEWQCGNCDYMTSDFEEVCDA